MTIDKYTKVILTLIAVGILGLNFHLLNGNIIKNAYASSGSIGFIATAAQDEVYLITKDGKLGCEIRSGKIKRNKWSETGC